MASREEDVQKAYETVPVKTLLEFYVGNIEPFFEKIFRFANIITRIYGFLFLNRGLQYTTKQIADAVEAPDRNVFRGLQDLQGSGLVKQVSRYTWTIEE